MAHLTAGVACAALSVSAFVLPACGGLTDSSSALPSEASGGSTSGGSTSAYTSTGGYATVTIGVGGTISIATGGATNSSGLSTVSDSDYSQLQSQSCVGFAASFNSQVNCSYAMPPLYICGRAHPALDEITVFLTTPQNVHYIVSNTNGACLNSEGYYLSDTGSTITLCGSPCEVLHSGKFAELEVFARCPVCIN